jgi:hypothetical protein
VLLIDLYFIAICINLGPQKTKKKETANRIPGEREIGMCLTRSSVGEWS